MVFRLTRLHLAYDAALLRLSPSCQVLNQVTEEDAMELCYELGTAIWDQLCLLLSGMRPCAWCCQQQVQYCVGFSSQKVYLAWALFGPVIGSCTDS